MHIINRNSPCWCGSGQKYKKCHYDFDQKLALYKRQGHMIPDHSMIKSPEQIQKIKESAKINIAVLDYVAEHIKEGTTTEEINQWVHTQTIKYGALPAPLNFEGFPKSVCTSINEEVCHGIPSSDIVLKDGDIINVDWSTNLTGYFSDSSRMFLIGQVSEEKKRLVEITRQCMYLGLEQVKPWNFLGDMGQAVNDFATQNGYQVVREIGGHGVGLEFHEDPWVSYVSTNGTEMLLVPGLVFTFEPMINMGTWEIVTDEKNGWTIRTADKKPSAQWEIQVLVTEDGHEVLAY